ncbi:alpha-L-fucosidase [Sediminibacterium sp.]|uniref:alpha-L-fucosidase n=1 Tax=Sediminibacterium sp. TaxID=1917865 RepID=UPI003F714056
MNKIVIAIFSLMLCFQVVGQTYKPTPQNLVARNQFQDNRFGMFIHWGVSSMLGAGEWVMQNRNIKVKDYVLLKETFYPSQFNAAEWVAAAKSAGMKYIVFITRHHDGFSNWDTQQSDWKITNTPYGKDALKQLADECKKQGMQLGLYYSTLDWFREDYPYTTGRTGQGTGRKSGGNYASYLKFMKAQLTELLTNYGEIMSIWFDGHWDQTNPEGSKDRSSRIDWKYNEIYELIHQLQPTCLIGNNHHLDPLPGEDFQMFEKDLPGQNHTGLSFQKPSDQLPLETCETMNNSWGYNITDHAHKSVKDLVHYLVKAASLNTNFLLNVGPMPNGKIQAENIDTLQQLGNWMKQYAVTIQGTRGNIIPAQEWGVVTAKDKKVYIHQLKQVVNNYIFVPISGVKVKSTVLFANKASVEFKQVNEGIFIYLKNIQQDSINTIIQLNLE